MRTRVLLSILFVWSLLAQQGPVRGEFSIAGSLTNSRTGERLRNALVSLIGPAGRRSSNTFTDAAGMFRFSDLPEGKYRISGERPGFTPMPTPIEVTLGPSNEGVSVRLDPLGVIKGRVVDSNGDPLSGVIVRALQSRIDNGRKRVSMVRWGSSNDRGNYRVWGLVPGEYYVKVAGRSGATIGFIGEAAVPTPSETFSPVFYGGGQSAATAAMLNVEGGAEIPADFSLNLQPSRVITGTVVNAEPYRPARIELFAGDEDIGLTRAAINVVSGQFIIRDVVDGVYTLRISQGDGLSRVRAVEAVQVAGRDVQGMVARLFPGSTVRGRVRFDGFSESSARPGCAVSLESLEPKDEGEEGVHYARMDQQQEFTIAAVLPGRYRVQVTAHGSYVASVSEGNRDLFAAGGTLTVLPGIAPAPIEVVLRNDGGQVTGTSATGHDAAVVALVPVTEQWRDVLKSWNSGEGQFTFSMVPPGEYRVHAWKAGNEPEYTNPQVRVLLSTRGEVLNVAPFGKNTLNLSGLSEVPK
jgi:hypothetical protein